MTAAHTTGAHTTAAHMTAAPPVLQARDLVAGYADRRTAVPIVGPVDLAVSPGRLVALLGPNGAGKTTLLRTLAGVMDPLEGDLRAGTDAGLVPLQRLRRDALARHVAVVLTDHPDVGLLRARDVVAIGRHPHTGWTGRLSPHDHAVVDRCLAAVDAGGFADTELSRLSDGQRQRVWIARALAQEPKVLLLDEPTAFLDLPGRVETVGVLRDLAASHDLAVVASIHDLDLALRVADTVWLMDGRGGVVVGAPEDLALQGRIDEAFGRDDIRFDITTASFSLPADCCADVRLVGTDGRTPDPTLALWTGRALTRAGAVVTGEPTAWLTVTVPDDAAGPWRVAAGADAVVTDTLAGLVSTVRAAAAVGLLAPPDGDAAAGVESPRQVAGRDVAVPDGVQPDGTVPDGALPAGAVPDGAVPDVDVPDGDGVPDGGVQRTGARPGSV